MWCQGSSHLPLPDSVNTSLLVSFLLQVSLCGLSGSHASVCMKLTGRTGANCRTQPCSQRFCSLVLGQVPGICLFNKLPREPDAGGLSAHLEKHSGASGDWGQALADPRRRFGFACTLIQTTCVGAYACCSGPCNLLASGQGA